MIHRSDLKSAKVERPRIDYLISVKNIISPTPFGVGL